jgi:hypothetical protein
MVSRTGLRALLIAASILSGAAAAGAQKTAPDIESLKKTAPRVYIDCSSCDIEYIKTEITFVNYVRDRKEAQVHILITRQMTGGGGKEYTLSFSGQHEFQGVDDLQRYYSNASDTDDDVRRGLVNTLKMGLVGYAARTPISGRMAVTFEPPEKPEAGPDKWKFWVFSLSFDGYFSGEKSYSSHSFGANLSANKITPDIKLRLGISAEYDGNSYVFEDETTKSNQQSYEFNGLLVKSMGEHWSVGAYLSASSSTYENIRFLVSPGPAIEYNLFPYSQSTRRQLRFLYRVSWETARYREETIFGKMRENLLKESLSVTMDVKEKWGSVSASLAGSHYFHDFSKYQLDLWGGVQLQLFKGLSAFVDGGGSWIHDQLNLIKGDATLEEILLRRRELETTYNYFLVFGFSYTFGSIYTNVVNPRFGSVGGGGVNVVMN